MIPMQSVPHHWRCQFESRSWWGVLITTLCDKVWKWFATGRWFSPVSSSNKTDCHDITEILLKVTLNTITPVLKFETKESSHQNHALYCQIKLHFHWWFLSIHGFLYHCSLCTLWTSRFGPQRHWGLHLCKLESVHQDNDSFYLYLHFHFWFLRQSFF